MNGAELLMFYCVGYLICGIICGICSAVIGASFLWGFVFGPLGILIAAVLVNGNRKPQVVVVNSGPRRRVRIVRHVEDCGRVESPPPVPPLIRERARPTGPMIARPTGRFERPA